MSQQMIYAIIDNVADSIVGPLWTMKHDAVAIRQFGDIANDKQTQISHHIEDYELRVLGFLDEENKLHAMDEAIVVITGKAWKAAQEQSNAQLSL